jgi:hypothetical protein
MFNLDLTSSGGFTGSVTLTCNGALLPGTCTVTPADRARSTDCCAPGFDSYRVRDGFYVCAIQAAAALALFGLLMLAFLCGFAACGGGAASGVVDPSPASNTYSLTVTGTSAGATRTPPLTLTVNTD